MIFKIENKRKGKEKNNKYIKFMTTIMFCHWTSNSSHQDYSITILKPTRIQTIISTETAGKQVVYLYNKMIISLIKTIDLNNVMYITDNCYRLIII